MTSFRQNREKPIMLPLNGHALGAQTGHIELKLVTLLLAIPKAISYSDFVKQKIQKNKSKTLYNLNLRLNFKFTKLI